MDINNISYHKNSRLINKKCNSDDGVTIVHCSDIHLGTEISFLKDNDAKKRRAEIMNTFKNVTQLCKQKSVDVLIVAGDLFVNHGVDLSIINSAKRCFADIPETIVAICAGNHDYLSADSPFCDNDWCDNVFIFGKELQYVEFPNMKLRLWGISFASTYIETPVFDKIDVPKDRYTNILVMHGDIIEGNQISRYNPITVEQLSRSNMDYVALGHIHKTTEVKKAGSTYYAYSGCPEGHDFDEQGKKGIYYGTVSKGSCNLQFIPMSKRILMELYVSIDNAYSNKEAVSMITTYLENQLGSTYKENLYRIVLKGTTAENYRPNCQYIQDALNEIVFYANVKNQSVPYVNFDILSKEVSLRGLFVKNMLNRIERCGDRFEEESLRNALYIGLNAFDSEVNIIDN